MPNEHLTRPSTRKLRSLFSGFRGPLVGFCILWSRLDRGFWKVLVQPLFDCGSLAGLHHALPSGETGALIVLSDNVGPGGINENRSTRPLPATVVRRVN